MLSATDLRAGNLVLRIMGEDRENEPFIEYKAVALEDHYYTFAADCFPIPLTSDILGFCGFKQQPDQWYKKLEADYMDDAAPVLRFKNENNNWYINDFKIPAQPIFVHQLQNLYYALTGQELIVNLGFYTNLPLFGPITFFNPIHRENKNEELL